MLLELNISNFALIDLLKLDFNKGLNILTGETGAGKSIIIDALSLVLGQRANRDSIRQGKDRSIVEALFQPPSRSKSKIKELLNQNGIEMEEDSSLILTREILSTGKSTCRINGRLVTLNLIKRLSEMLIDIHGQHEHQSLLHWETHIDLLDSYGQKELGKELQDTKAYYKQYKDCKKVLNSFIKDEKEFEREKDLLKFQLDEINQGKLKNIEEDKELEERRRLLTHSEKLFQNTKKAYELLYSGKEIQKSIYDQLSEVLNSIENVSMIDPSMEGILEQLKSAFVQIEDAAFEIRGYSENIEFHQEELDQIEKRLNSINQLKRKYGESIEEILKYRKTLQSKLSKLENKNQEIEHLQKKIDKGWKSYREAAKNLSNKRKKIAAFLETNIIKELKDLGMKKVQFKVDIQTSEEFSSERGIDRVEFMISPNPGQSLCPLARIASGGEIARIMLALKSIFAKVDNIDTLIFDEIDTGISGRTAQIVAKKMAFLSKDYQIICITHLPQIASMADNHYLIEKEINQNQTTTKVYHLEEDERIRELARMLGGAALTELTLKHSKEMFQIAKKVKKQF